MDCKTCQYYVPYYVKHVRHLLELDGHCTHVEKRRGKDAWNLREKCALWTPSADKKEERKKCIEEMLRDMAKTLEDIRLILESDSHSAP